MSTDVTFATVAKLASALPGVERSTSWGSPSLKVRGKMFACIANHKSAEKGTLVVRMDFAQRDALVAEEPGVFYLKDHYVGYPCVLVRLSKVTPDMLRGLLETGHRFVTRVVQKSKGPKVQRS